MSPADLDATLARLRAGAGGVVVAVGDMMLDRYLKGDVDRVSPEGPVPVVHVRDRTAVLGGAANVVANLAGLGMEVRPVGVVGRDPEGDLLMRRLERVATDISGIVRSPDRQTTVKTRVVARSQQLLRFDSEVVDGVGPELEGRLLEVVDGALEGADSVVLSDYGKGVCSGRLVRAVIRAAGARGIPTVVDPLGGEQDIDKYAGATVLTPNERELHELTRRAPADVTGCSGHAAWLGEQTGVPNVVVTRGAAGMALWADGRWLEIPARAREVFDISGAGDTVAAVVAACMGAGAALPEALQVANAAAGIVVGHFGTRPFELAMFEEADRERGATSTEADAGRAQLLSLPDLGEAASGWRREGLRIGFTNGCFDLLHPGHLRVLAEASAGSDVLIVGVNSDDSVRRLKGPDRPINPVEARVELLRALRWVDGVVVFGEDTPIEVIEALRPDLLVKGGDYEPDEVVGAECVTGHGGDVRIVPLLPGSSTTDMVRRIQEGSLSAPDGGASTPKGPSPSARDEDRDAPDGAP